MVSKEGGIVTASAEARRLCCRCGVQEAEGERIELRRAGRSRDLDDGDRIPAQEQMATLTLKSNRMVNGELGCFLPPAKAVGRWIGAEVAQLSTVDLRLQLRFEQFPYRRLAHPARAGHE